MISAMDGDRLDALDVAYDELVERAVAAGLLPAATGWTLREQAARLGAAGRLPAEDVTRLARLVERARHAGHATAAERDQARALCRDLAASLPAPASPPGAATSPEAGGTRARRAAAADWTERLGFLEPLLLPLVMTAVVGLVVWGLVQGAAGGLGGGLGGGFGGVFGGGSGGVRGGGHGGTAAWAGNYRSELASVRAAWGEWDSSANRKRWKSYSQAVTIEAGRPGPGFDLVTGVDGRFTGRPSVRCVPDLGATYRLFVYDRVGPGHVFLAPAGPLVDAQGEGELATDSARISSDTRLRAGRPVPLPSAAPDAEVLFASCDEPVDLEVLRDRADALFVVADRSLTATVTTIQATTDDYHFAPLQEVPFEARDLPLPADVRADAEVVLERIGGLPADTFGATVRRLQSYFGGFSVAPLTDDERLANGFLTVALARKGVCRHRARAFVICALALGVEARLVENVTHSFAEVRQPDDSWRRIELRLSDGEQPELPDTARARELGFGQGSPSPDLGWVLAAFALATLVVVALARRHRRLGEEHLLRADQPELRPWRRARRDHGLSGQRQALDRLLDVVQLRLAARLGRDPSDLAGLDAAVESLDVEDHLRERLRNALRLAADRGSDARPDASNLQYAYWNSYHVLRWVEGGRPW